MELWIIGPIVGGVLFIVFGVIIGIFACRARNNRNAIFQAHLNNVQMTLNDPNFIKLQQNMQQQSMAMGLGGMGMGMESTAWKLLA